MKWKLLGTGKARNVYVDESGNYLKLVASDRVSAFDKILPVIIPGKGANLSRQSKAMTRLVSSICPVASVLDDFLDENVDVQMRLDMLPSECIVTKYLVGSLFKEYLKACDVCGDGLVVTIRGVEIPVGLSEGAELKAPIFRPSTKAPQGEHDEYLSFDELVAHYERHNVSNARQVAENVRDYSIVAYRKAADFMFQRGYYLIDTKLEFGFDIDGALRLGDEVCTCDSSRYCKVGDWTPGNKLVSADKQIIRDYISAEQAAGREITDIPANIVAKTINAYSQITMAME